MSILVYMVSRRAIPFPRGVKQDMRFGTDTSVLESLVCAMELRQLYHGKASQAHLVDSPQQLRTRQGCLAGAAEIHPLRRVPRDFLLGNAPFPW